MLAGVLFSHVIAKPLPPTITLHSTQTHTYTQLTRWIWEKWKQDKCKPGRKLAIRRNENRRYWKKPDYDTLVTLSSLIARYTCANVCVCACAHSGFFFLQICKKKLLAFVPFLHLSQTWQHTNPTIIIFVFVSFFCNFKHFKLSTTLFMFRSLPILLDIFMCLFVEWMSYIIPFVQQYRMVKSIPILQVNSGKSFTSCPLFQQPSASTIVQQFFFSILLCVVLASRWFC